MWIGAQCSASRRLADLCGSELNAAQVGAHGRSTPIFPHAKIPSHTLTFDVHYHMSAQGHIMIHAWLLCSDTICITSEQQPPLMQSLLKHISSLSFMQHPKCSPPQPALAPNLTGTPPLPREPQFHPRQIQPTKALDKPTPTFHSKPTSKSNMRGTHHSVVVLTPSPHMHSFSVLMPR